MKNPIGEDRNNLKHQENPEKGQAVEYFKKAVILGYKLPSEVQDLLQQIGK